MKCTLEAHAARSSSRPWFSASASAGCPHPLGWLRADRACAWILLCWGVACWVAVCGLPLRGTGVRAAEQGSDLADRQKDMGSQLQDIARRMTRLADRIQKGQPEEAGRLRDAAERIRVTRIEELFDRISELLRRPSFLEALGRQEEAIRELDAHAGTQFDPKLVPLFVSLIQDGSLPLPARSGATHHVLVAPGRA